MQIKHFAHGGPAGSRLPHPVVVVVVVMKEEEEKEEAEEGEKM